MSGATRDLDDHSCPEHGIGSGVAARPSNVTINGRAAARAGDGCTCFGPINFVVTGASGVLIKGAPAARVGSLTLHGGAVTTGSGTVRIGGPAAGGQLGRADAGKTACIVAGQGRAGGGLGQSYGNCGLESWRIFLNHDRERRGEQPVDEVTLLQEAIDRDLAHGPINDTVSPWAIGASNDLQRAELFGSHGIQIQTARGGTGLVSELVADGHPVVVTVAAASVWPEETGVSPDATHVIAVTGVEYGPDGRPAAFIVNDTGKGECGRRISAAALDDGLSKRGGAIEYAPDLQW